MGQFYLGLPGRLEDAKANCDAALKADPGNQTAKSCLEQVASRLIDESLNNANARLMEGDYKGAIETASKWTQSAMREEQKRLAQDIVRRVHRSPGYIWGGFPDWLRQALIAIALITGLAIVLNVFRMLWREFRRASWYGPLVNKTRWRMLPLKEMTDAPTGIPTDHFLDALLRLPDLLSCPMWEPRLLLLRPTPPADHDPAIIDDFVSSLNPPPIALSPEPKNLGLNWKEHDIQLDEAFQNLQLKVVSGLDLGTLAKWLYSVVHWFNAGAPTISGVAQTAADGAKSIHIAASGGKMRCISVTAETADAPGIDVTRLTAERAAFKLLLRMNYSNMTHNEIEGLAALRQAIALFSQYAGTARGSGDAATARDSSLRQAAGDFGLFRCSIPLHSSASHTAEACSAAIITVEIRQAVLLAEGVSHALIGDSAGLSGAIGCFRELQDWPGSRKTASLHHQAAYNEAVVWRLKGAYQQAVLMLTELLGEYAPDTRPSPDTGQAAERAGESLLSTGLGLGKDDVIRYPARLARLSAFAEYTLEDWSTLPPERIELLTNDAEKLIGDLKDLAKTLTIERERRIVQYVYQETLRSVGHIELLRVIRDAPAGLYDQSHRPMGLRTGELEAEGQARLRQAIRWMEEAEETLPNATLYLDLSEAHLLLKEFDKAGGYARHVTLQKNQPVERAFYLAAESYLLEDTAPARDFARRYAAQFEKPALSEFLALRSELGIGT